MVPKTEDAAEDFQSEASKIPIRLHKYPYGIRFSGLHHIHQKLIPGRTGSRYRCNKTSNSCDYAKNVNFIKKNLTDGTWTKDERAAQTDPSRQKETCDVLLNFDFPD